MPGTESAPKRRAFVHAPVQRNPNPNTKNCHFHSLKHLIFVRNFTAMAKKLIRFDWAIEVLRR